MSFREAPVLETERLVLRPYRLEDFDAFAAYFASSRSRFTDGPVSRIQAWDLFTAGAGRWAIAGHGAWSITVRGDDAGIGLVALNTPITLPYPELGYILWQGFEGRGTAREAAEAARDFAFDRLGWSTLISGIHKDNASSIRLAERMGAVADSSIKLEDEPETLFFRHTKRTPRTSPNA
ncbi:MAG: GNAT family N-acetyltransferase [Pseudomonadota bacterium]